MQTKEQVNALGILIQEQKKNPLIYMNNYQQFFSNICLMFQRTYIEDEVNNAKREIAKKFYWYMNEYAN